MNFWEKLEKPFYVLAPMADVTDSAYRRLIAETAKPDVTWTEFVSADGLYHTREMKKMPDSENPLMRDLQFSDTERPIVAQLFSSKPEMMAYAAELVTNLGFDGIDINMGCPDKSIEKQGCGAAMIKNPALAKQIIEAAREGSRRAVEARREQKDTSAGTSKSQSTEGIPVSVKTRIGYNSENIAEWISAVLETKPAALTVHLRTRKEMSKVPAHWDLMPRVVALRDAISPKTRILGNGDVKDLKDAKQKIEETGADGVMLGRAIFGNPYVFGEKSSEDVSLAERLTSLTRLAQYFDAMRPKKSFHIFRKHIKAFVIGFDGAAELRAKLMECETAEEVERVVAEASVS